MKDFAAPTTAQLLSLLGETRLAAFERICAQIDALYDMEHSWDDGVKKPEYIAPNRPNTRPDISGAAFSCRSVVDAVCTIVSAMPYTAIIIRYYSGHLISTFLVSALMYVLQVWVIKKSSYF